MTKGKILVVGGGIAGLTAAEKLARACLEVVLAEKSSALGGRVARLHRYYPRLCPPRCGLEVLTGSIQSFSNVEIHLLSEVVEVKKTAPGLHTVTIFKQPDEELTLDVNGLIIATGADLYDASLIKEYGYGQLPGVITAMELESIFRPDGPTGGLPVHPATGGPLRRVAFIQCAGSRNKNHLPYCSGYCCTVTLKQVQYLHQSLKDIQAWIFYQDIRTPGSKEEYYRQVREEYRPVLIRGLPSGIDYRADTGDLTVRCVDTLSDKEVRGNFDLVVLATGMAPPDLPDFYRIERDSFGFPAGHLPCDPSELRRSGIWAAGCVQSPMDAEDSVKSALAAVAQCLVKLQQQPALYPRLDPRKCDRCGRCVKECPYGACILGSDGYPLVDPGDCRSCGICQGGCPLLCLNLPGQGGKRIEEVVDRVLSQENPTPPILLFLCGNDAYPAWKKLTDLIEDNSLQGIIPLVVPCIGAVNAAWINEALIGGLDGVMLAGCPDDQCHHSAGPPLTATRMENLKETLARMRLEPQRVQITAISMDDSLKLSGELQRFKKTLEKLGPNPFR